MIKKYLIAASASALVLAGAYALGYSSGKANVQAAWDKEVANQVREDHEVLLVGMRDTFELGQQHEEQKEVIRYEVETIIKKIPVYITDTSGCERLPDNWGLLHRASTQAANERLPVGQLDDAGAAAVLGIEP